MKLKSQKAKTNDQTKLTVIYVRNATEQTPSMGRSLHDQVDACQDYVEHANLGDSVSLREPKPVGGNLPLEQREAGRELIRLCKSGGVAHLVARDIARFARDAEVWQQLVEICRANAITIHTASGPLDTESQVKPFIPKSP